MTQRKRYKGSLLVAMGAVLILLIAVLLVSLSGPVTKEPPSAPGEAATRDRPVARGLNRRLLTPDPPGPAGQAPSDRRQTTGDGGSDGGPVVSAAGGDSGAVDQSGDRPAPAAPIPSTARAAAPPAIPSTIREEKDPARRAELMKLHRLSTARVRVSRLKRRTRLLQRSITQAEREGSWSEDKLKGARQRLRDLSSAIPQAEEELQKVQQEVAGGP